MTDVDVLIVGGGPAGLSAAVALRQQGVSRVLIVDREKALGGIPRHCHHSGFGWFDLRRVLSGPQYAAKRVKLLQKSKASFLTETTVLGWRGANCLKLTGPQGVQEISARAVLLATGCRERPRSARLVPGYRPFGIFTTGSLQQWVYSNGKRAGLKAVVIGAEHVSFSALHTLHTSGTEVAALVTEYPKHQTYGIFRLLTASRYRTPILSETVVKQILGRNRVEAIEVENTRTADLSTISCDTVVFTGDWIPDHELARLGGIEIDKGTKGPSVDLAFRTSKEGVFAAGNLIHGAETADVAGIEGSWAAQSIVHSLREGTEVTQGIPLRLDPKLLWVAPNRISKTSFVDHFVFRTRVFLRKAQLQVRQGGRVLFSVSYRKLVPNRSHRFSNRWVSAADVNGEPIQLELSGEPYGS